MNNSDINSRQMAINRIGYARQFGMERMPGLCFCLLVVFAASYICEHYGSSQVLAALLLGMAFNSISKHQEFSAGINFCASHLMRFGVALLGVRITFEQINELGYLPVLVVAVVVFATIAFSLLMAWALKIDIVKAVISGAAVAICGASAALAVAAVLPRSKSTDNHLLCSLVAVTGLSTFAMIAYPGLLKSMDLAPEQIGIILGASIHDVAQVMGAGHMLSEEIADLATYTKMLRVAMLVPIITIVAFIFRAQTPGATRSLVFPPFLITFVALMILANMHLLSASVIEWMGKGSQFLLWTAMAALGTKTNPVEMWEVGRKPMLILLMNTVFIAALAFFLVS